MPDRPYAKLGQRIRAARKKLGLRQADLAVLLKTDSTQMWKWESGFRRPKPERLQEIAELLLVTMEHLLTGKVARKKDARAKTLRRISELSAPVSS